MKAKISPTSPKGKLESSEADVQKFLAGNDQFVKPSKPRSIWTIILVGGFGGLIAGVAGALLLTSLALGNPGASFWSWLGITLPETREREVIIRDEGASTSLQDLLSRVGPAVLALSSQPGDILNRDVTGNALALSSDGYVVSVQDVSASGSTNAILSPTTVVRVDGVAVDDSASPLRAFRLTTDSLPVTTIGTPESLTTGDAFIAVRRTAQGSLAFHTSTLIEANMLPRDDGTALYLSSEIITRRHQIMPLPEEYRGAPVFTMGGDAAGLVLDPAAGIVMPLDPLRPVLDRLLTTGTFERSRLGVRYRDLAWMPDIRPETEFPHSGALIAGDGERGVVAVQPGSPAETAGLRDGDRIIAVNGVPLSAPEDLTTNIQQFSVGETVTLKFVREGTEQTVDVPLGSQ